MQEFLSINPGIASRIGYKFHFKDYSSQELTDIFQLRINNMGFTVEENMLVDVKKIMAYFSSMDNFGNGRFVNKYVQEAMILHSKNNPDNFETLKKEDLPTIEYMSSVVSLRDAEYVPEEYAELNDNIECISIMETSYLPQLENPTKVMDIIEEYWK